jgi:hypothetical protein
VRSEPYKLSDDSPTTADAWFTPLRFAVILGFFIVAAYPNVLWIGPKIVIGSTVVLDQETFFHRDFGFFGYPLAFHHRQSFWHGEIPLWNPLNNCGLPFLAQWNTLVLYPGSLFYLLFPLSWSLGVFCLLHQFGAGLGMYFLARRWTGNGLAASVAGVAFAFNGLTLNCLMWPNNIAALGWMPWVVLAVERAWRQGGRSLFSAVILGSMQMLSGAPEIILLTWVILGALWLSQWIGGELPRGRLLVRVALVGTLTLLMSAAQLLPFLDLLSHSQRDTSYGDSYGSMPIWGWANLLVPMFNCFTKFFGVYAQFSQYWTSSYYPGIGVLLLALWSMLEIRKRRVWILIAVSVLGFVLALGDEGLLYAWLRKSVPQFGFMRYPIKFVVLPTFCVPLLSAFGLSRFAGARTGTAITRAWRLSFVLGFFLLASIAGIVWFAWRYPALSGTWPTTWPDALSRSALLILTLATLKALLQSPVRRSKIVAGAALVTLAWLDGWTHMPRQNPVIDRAAFDPGLVRVNPQPRHGESRAMISPAAEARFHHFGSTNARDDYLVSRLGLYINCNLLDGIPKVDGTYSLYLRGPIRVEENLLKVSPDPNRELPSLLDFLGVSLITAPGEFFQWTNRAGALPMSTGGQLPVFADDTTTFRALAHPSFTPREIVYLPLEARPFVQITNRTDTRVVASRFTAHQGEIEITGQQPGLLVVAQAYYHRWRALVDGQPQRIWRANLGYQALQIPSGTHLVQIFYRDAAFRCGAFVSLLALIVCAAVWRRRRSTFASSGSTAFD